MENLDSLLREYLETAKGIETALERAEKRIRSSRGEKYYAAMRQHQQLLDMKADNDAAIRLISRSMQPPKAMG